MNKDLPEIVVSAAGLSGGKSGTSPTVRASTRRQYSSNLLVDPVDYRWMRTYADKPTVQVTVNGIVSACNANCEYTFIESVPTLTALSTTGNTVSISLSDPQNLNSPLINLTVTIDSKPCTALTGTMASFTCELPTNPDNSPVLTAGNHYPMIKIEPLGYAAIDTNVPAITVTLAMASITPARGNANGGYDITILGSGFPENTRDIAFKICDQLCTIKSLTNVNAIVTIPQC